MLRPLLIGTALVAAFFPLLGLRRLGLSTYGLDAFGVALGGLGVNVGFSSVSNAQTGVSEGTENMISAAEQRKSMVTELRGISARLDKIDATLAKGGNVNVKNFPANFGKDGDKTDAPSESTRQPEIKKVDRPAPKTGNLQQK